jgi:pyruvate/2-oxoglutarate/acetoin dehydrogenase E1 component
VKGVGNVRELTYLGAVNEALRQALRADQDVLLIGEDVAGGGFKVKDAWGGVYGATQGLLTDFGAERVRDTPISETAFIGAAVGAAAMGLRPVVELMHADFLGVCFDQVLNQAAKLHFMSGGQIAVPVTIRTTIGGGMRAASHHSQPLSSIFAHIPGLKTVAPATPYDAKGLLLAAIADPDPVVVLENKVLYGTRGEVPEDPYQVPIGRGEVRRTGQDVTIVAYSRMVQVAEAAAAELASEGVSAEVIDLRSLYPLDEEMVLASVGKTHRIVVVDEDTPVCSVASEIVALVAERALGDLDAPPRRVTAPHAPVPFSPALEDAFLPSKERVVEAVKGVFGEV